MLKKDVKVNIIGAGISGANKGVWKISFYTIKSNRLTQ